MSKRIVMTETAAEPQSAPQNVETIVAELKRRHNLTEVHVIEVEAPDGGEPLRAYLKTPDRATISRSISLAQTDPLRANEIVLNSCWLAGDEIIKTNDSFFISAASVLGELLTIRKAALRSFR